MLARDSLQEANFTSMLVCAYVLPEAATATYRDSYSPRYRRVSTHVSSDDSGILECVLLKAANGSQSQVSP